MSCKQARELFGVYWDDEVTQAEREWLEGHFAACAACRTSYDDLARTLELVGSLPRAEVTPGFAERVVSRTRPTASEPDRIPAATALWIPITAAAALLAVVGATVLQWTGLPLAPSRRAAPVAVQEPVEQPVRVAREPAAPATGRTTGALGSAGEGLLAGSLIEIPDSLFDHGEDVEFILDPVTLRKGRAHTVVRVPQDKSRAQRAVITF